MTWKRHAYLTAVCLAAMLQLLCGACRGEERKTGRTAEIVASVLKAYGGAEALSKVVSVAAKGEITEFLSGKTGDYARYFERPGKLRIEVMPGSGGEIRILNKDRGWQSGDAGFTPASPLELQSMLYQYSYLNLPMGFARGNYQVKYGGKQQLKGRDVYLLLVDPKNAPRLGILVDTKTRLILRVDASFPMGPMGTGELSTEYSDFRSVDGVKFPFLLTSFAGGLKLSEIVLTEVTVNSKIPPELFTPRQ